MPEAPRVEEAAVGLVPARHARLLRRPLERRMLRQKACCERERKRGTVSDGIIKARETDRESTVQR